MATTETEIEVAHVTEYQILNGETPAALGALVGTAIGNGWQPWGPPWINSTGRNPSFLQAIVKYGYDLAPVA